MQFNYLNHKHDVRWELTSSAVGFSPVQVCEEYIWLAQKN